jgi:hypothetical protein
MPFEPGVSGNPGGKPKSTKQFKDALLLAVNRADGDKVKLAQIAEALVEKAIAGDVQAINAVADRLDGKPVQAIAGDPENPLEFRLSGLKDELTKRAARFATPGESAAVPSDPQ